MKEHIDPIYTRNMWLQSSCRGDNMKTWTATATGEFSMFATFSRFNKDNIQQKVKAPPISLARVWQRFITVIKRLPDSK